MMKKIFYLSLLAALTFSIAPYGDPAHPPRTKTSTTNNHAKTYPVFDSSKADLDYGDPAHPPRT